MKVTIPKNDIKRMTEKFTDIEKKQIPFATRYSINALVTATVNKTKEEIKQKLDWEKHIPYITKYKFATKQNMGGEVFLNKKSWGWYALNQHFNSGERSKKGLESWLKKHRFLGVNDFLIASKDGKTTSGASKMILRDFKKKSFNRFFIINNSKNSNKNGIYAKSEIGKVFMLFKIVRAPYYKQRIDLKQIPRKIWIEKGRDFFKKGMEIGMKNAK